MHQGQAPAFPAGLNELRSLLENDWSNRIAALRASNVPVNLYDDLTDEQLKAKAIDLGITVADDADRATIAAAIDEHEKETPPWGDNFDPERAWRLVQNLRGDLGKTKSERDGLRSKVKEHEDAEKTEQERAAERTAEAERIARESTLEAARLRVALKKDLTESQAKRLVGETEEELEADADELLASFVTEEEGVQVTRLPRERLRPGAVPNVEPEKTDPAELADLIPRR